MQVTTEKKKTKERLYWARAAEHRQGNWIQQKKAMDGSLIQREVSLKFHDHILATDDPKKIKFIENCPSFAIGSIILCEDAKEAQLLTAKQEIRKRGKEHEENTDISRVFIKPGGTQEVVQPVSSTE